MSEGFEQEFQNAIDEADEENFNSIMDT